MEKERKITITITGREHIGKQGVVLFLEKFLKEELKAKSVTIPAHIEATKQAAFERGQDLTHLAFENAPEWYSTVDFEIVEVPGDGK